MSCADMALAAHPPVDYPTRSVPGETVDVLDSWRALFSEKDFVEPPLRPAPSHLVLGSSLFWVRWPLVYEQPDGRS